MNAPKPSDGRTPDERGAVPVPVLRLLRAGSQRALERDSQLQLIGPCSCVIPELWPMRQPDSQNAVMTVQELRVGDRIWVGGGHSNHPAWLVDGDAYDGRVVEFIPGQNEKPAAVVELESEVVLPAGAIEGEEGEVRGRFVVLELGHVGTDWSTPSPRINVELCDFRPEAKRWQDRRQGVWVESHASYGFT